VVDQATLHSPEGGNLRTSCNTASGKAYPPRRIVEVARQLGENGIVQSICQSDFTPALDTIIELIATKIGAMCVPRPLIRTSSGKVSCSMLWELPAPSLATPAGTPTQCGSPGWEFLLPSDKPPTSNGGVVCEVAQLAVHGSDGARSYVATDQDGQHFTEGWYYDDFSERLAKDCPAHARHALAFSSNGAPPTGVVVKLECRNEVQTYDAHRTDAAPNRTRPAIGTPCEEVSRNGQTLRGHEACAIELANGTTDRSMFCHPELNVCVLGCSTTADCPPAWVCDDRESTLLSTAGANICVNPTCGDLK
jgi:hypothetical protein